jgi:hypothetical protein
VKIDVLYHWHEPPSFGALALADARALGVVNHAIPMTMSPAAQVYDALKKSDASAIVFVSPAQYSDFFTQVPDLRALGKPLISFATEWCRGNTITEYSDFQDSAAFFDFYACGQECDALAMRHLGRSAAVSPLWVSTMAFRPGPPLRERKQRLAFVGDTTEYRPGIYATRRRMLSALQARGLIDIIQIPKGIPTAHQVACLYANYAGVFCPPSNGRAQGIRLYEAAASGALIIEAQPMEPQNEYFKAGRHRLALDPDISDSDLCDFVASLDFARHQDIATRATELVQQHFTAAAILPQLVAAADKTPIA